MIFSDFSWLARPQQSIREQDSIRETETNTWLTGRAAFFWNAVPKKEIRCTPKEIWLHPSILLVFALPCRRVQVGDVGNVAPRIHGKPDPP